MTDYSLNRGLRVEKDKIIVNHINIRQSISILIIKLIVVDIFAAILVGVVYVFLNFGEVGSYLGIDPTAATFIVFASLAFIKLSISWYIVLDWISEYYELRPTCIIYRHGIIFTKEEKINFTDIRKIAVKQGLMGKFLNYGTIEVYDFLMQKSLNAYLIHNPLRYENLLADLIPEVEEEKDLVRNKSINDVD